MGKKLQAPQNLKIDFKPSERQYEVWKNLQPECPYCGGEIIQVEIGRDRNNQPLYKPQCKNCGETDIPQVILEGGSAGGGKAGLLDSEICTPFGFRKLRDIKVGDMITSATTGGVQKVVYLHPIGLFDFYRVKFRDGTYFDCSEGHLWQVHESRTKSKKAKKYGISTDEVWPTIKMFEWFKSKEAGLHEGQNLIIPLPEPVKYNFGAKGNYYIDPYVMGALIGDGCLAECNIQRGIVSFTTMDQEIEERMIACGVDMSHKKSTNSRAFTYDIYDKDILGCIKKHGIAGNTSKNHFIPKVYKFSSVEDRIKLMQGLMDTDGYVDDRGHMSYTTTSEQLAEDVAFVVRSLGGVATITSDIGSYKKDGEKILCSRAYTVYFRTKMDPDLCGLKRKRERAKYEFNGGNSEYGKRVVGVEYLGKKEGRCISVSEPNGLYVVNDFTVTHNSFLGSAWLVSSCLRWSDMRMVVARQTLKSLRESTWNTILSIVKTWGLEEDVNYRVDNLHGEMIFWNDSKIIMKELADTLIDPDFNRLGSSEYSGAFVDEVSQISQKAIDVLGSRIRWKVESTTKVPKLLMSTNPCLGWVRDRFVLDENGNDVICAPGDRYLPFSVFDNPDEAFRRSYLVALDNIKDVATKERLKYGNWNWVDTNDAAAYWNFDGAKHLVTGLKDCVYDPTAPIILSWDFNVMPYLSTLSIQIDYNEKKVYVIEENLGKPEDKLNNTPAFARALANKFLNEKHIGGLLITGDPSGIARSTQTEEGVNNYTIILGNMSNPSLHVEKKLLNKQPSQVSRLEFVNALFTGYDGWQILIDMKCRKFTEDLVYQKKNSDGTKCKAKVADPKSGVKYEKYGHLSDCFDYALVLFLPEVWAKFQRKSTSVETTCSVVYGGFEY